MEAKNEGGQSGNILLHEFYPLIANNQDCRMCTSCGAGTAACARAARPCGPCHTAPPDLPHTRSNTSTPFSIPYTPTLFPSAHVSPSTPLSSPPLLPRHLSTEKRRRDNSYYIIVPLRSSSPACSTSAWAQNWLSSPA
jgi:hypothetical protein